MRKSNDKRGLAAKTWRATCPLNFGYIFFSIGLAIVILGVGLAICNRDLGFPWIWTYRLDTHTHTHTGYYIIPS